MLPNRVVIGAEADASFPSFQNLAGISIGGASTFTSPTLGAEATARRCSLPARCGAASAMLPKWLFYATGGSAWTYDQLRLTNWPAGRLTCLSCGDLAGQPGRRRGPYCRTGPRGSNIYSPTTALSSVLFANPGQRFNSDFSLQEVRAGLNYQFGDGAPAANAAAQGQRPRHGQTTRAEQADPAFRSPLTAPKSLPGGGQGPKLGTSRCLPVCGCGRAPSCGSTPRSIRVSVPGTHGVAGFPSAESYKLGSPIPTRASSAISSGRPSISAAKRRRWTPTSVSSPLADGEPPGGNGRQVPRRRHIRCQQICEQSQSDF